MPPCCSRPGREPLPGGADFGVMAWVGSHVIRQNSDARQGNTFGAPMGAAFRLPTAHPTAPKGPREGPICAPTARRFFLPNSPKGPRERSQCAPSARPLCDGYRRRSAEFRQGFDAPAGSGHLYTLNAHLRHSPESRKGR